MDTLETVNSKNKWLEVFAKDVVTDDLYIGCCMWHIFSYGRSPFQYIEHEAAIDAFNILDKNECYLFFQSSEFGYRIKKSKLTSKIISDIIRFHGDDIYILDVDLKWTFIVTHEDPWFGPYLCHADEQNRTQIVCQKQISDMSIQKSQSVHIRSPFRRFNITAIEKKTMKKFLQNELPAKEMRDIIRCSTPALSRRNSKSCDHTHIWRRLDLMSPQIDAMALILHSMDTAFDLAFLNRRTLKDNRKKELIITVFKEPFGISNNPVYLKTPQDAELIYDMLSNVDRRIFKEKHDMMILNEIEYDELTHCESLLASLDEMAHFFKMISEDQIFATAFISSYSDELSFICPNCNCELFITAEKCPVCNMVIKIPIDDTGKWME